MIIFKKPHNKTLLAFLQSKGWTLEKATRVYYIMMPPKAIRFKNPSFRYFIPTNEDAIDYDEFTFQLIRSIAQLYEMKLQDLMDILSCSLEEIQEDIQDKPHQIEIKRAMLASAGT